MYLVLSTEILGHESGTRGYDAPMSTGARRPTGPRRVTISDVAELAGVSTAAVSRSFNGAERLPPSTVKRIHDAAAQLGWRPNATARAMKRAAAHTFGFILLRAPDLLGSDPFFPLFLAGLEPGLSADAYALMIRFVSTAEEEKNCYRDWVAEGRVDGFVLTDLRDDDYRLDLLAELNVPAVVAGDPGRSTPSSAVFHTTDGCIREMVDGWADRGHSRIAHVMGDPALLHARRRRDVWAAAMAARGLRTDLIAEGGFTEAGADQATRKLIAAENPPTAIFYGSDVMAAAGMRTLAELEVRVGVDIAIAGFDDVPLAPYLSPPLATIACDYRELGAEAAAILLEEVSRSHPRGRSARAGKRLELDGAFIARASYEIEPGPSSPRETSSSAA